MLFNLNVIPAFFFFFAFEFSLINKIPRYFLCLLIWTSIVGLYKLVGAGLVVSRKAVKYGYVLCVHLN